MSPLSFLHRPSGLHSCAYGTSLSPLPIHGSLTSHFQLFFKSISFYIILVFTHCSHKFSDLKSWQFFWEGGFFCCMWKVEYKLTQLFNVIVTHWSGNQCAYIWELWCLKIIKILTKNFRCLISSSITNFNLSLQNIQLEWRRSLWIASQNDFTFLM